VRRELREEMHRARAALLTAVEVRCLAVHEIEATRADAGEDAGEGGPFPLDDLRDDGLLPL